jgi:hypothetical protein
MARSDSQSNSSDDDSAGSSVPTISDEDDSSDESNSSDSGSSESSESPPPKAKKTKHVEHRKESRPKHGDKRKPVERAKEKPSHRHASKERHASSSSKRDDRSSKRDDRRASSSSREHRHESAPRRESRPDRPTHARDVPDDDTPDVTQVYTPHKMVDAYIAAEVAFRVLLTQTGASKREDWARLSPQEKFESLCAQFTEGTFWKWNKNAPLEEETAKSRKKAELIMRWARMDHVPLKPGPKCMDARYANAALFQPAWQIYVALDWLIAAYSEYVAREKSAALDPDQTAHKGIWWPKKIESPSTFKLRNGKSLCPSSYRVPA